MFGLFKKREPEKKEEAPTVVVEVPIQPTTCIQPAEHAMLAKVRALQVEREEIKAFLDSDPLNVDTPEVHKFAVTLAAKTLAAVHDKFSFHSYWRYETTEDMLRCLSQIYEQALPTAATNGDMNAFSAEIDIIERKKVECEQKKARLNQIAKEIRALKKSLGISE